MRARLRADAVLAVVLPVVVALLLLAVRPGQTPGTPDAAESAPRTTPLTTAAVVCPSALPGAAATGQAGQAGDLVGLTTLAGGPTGTTSGQVGVGLGPAASNAPVRTGRVTSAAPAAGPVVVTGTGALAPGLVAGRSTGKPLAATDCAPVAGDRWFTGVGAGPSHDSVVELVNPGTGTAEADVSVWSSSGPVQVDRLRGVSVPSGQAVQLDLGQLTPRRGSLAVEVHVDRGQLASSVADSDDELGDGQVVRDWLPGQPEPATRNLLLGLAGGAGPRTLTLMNPGNDEARATLQVVTATGVFSPAGVDPVRVPPGATASVSLGEQLTQQTAQGATGLLVTSSAPLTAGLRQVTDGDLSDLAPAGSLTASSAAVVPSGAKRLLLADPSAVGDAAVAWFAADGTRLGGQTVELRPDSGGDVTLPDDAVLVTVDPQRTTVRASVLVATAPTKTAGGTAVVALRELQRTGLVPDVRPGLP